MYSFDRSKYRVIFVFSVLIFDNLIESYVRMRFLILLECLFGASQNDFHLLFIEQIVLKLSYKPWFFHKIFDPINK